MEQHWERGFLIAGFTLFPCPLEFKEVQSYTLNNTEINPGKGKATGEDFLKRQSSYGGGGVIFQRLFPFSPLKNDHRNLLILFLTLCLENLGGIRVRLFFSDSWLA